MNELHKLVEKWRDESLRERNVADDCTTVYVSDRIDALLADLTAALAGGGEAVGYIAKSSIDALNACRNDEHNGYTRIWMRPRDSETIPLFSHHAGAVQVTEVPFFAIIRGIEYRTPQELCAAHADALDALARAAVRICGRCLGRCRRDTAHGESEPCPACQGSGIDMATVPKANPAPPTSSQGNVQPESLTSGTAKESEPTPAQAGAELPAVDLAAENSVMREALSKISRVNACDYEYVRWAREALSSLARRGGSDG